MPTDTTAQFSASSVAKTGSNATLRGLQQAFFPPEHLMILLTICVGVWAFALSIRFDQAVAWSAFMISFAPAVGMILLGLYIRTHKNMPRAAMAAIGTGVYIGFTGVVTILIYLRFPFQTPMIDAQLMQMDAVLFGYEWAGFTSAVAAYPIFGRALGWVYGTSLLQLFGVLFLLSFLNRQVDLHRVMITGILSLLFAVIIWWAWPSLGPSAYVTLPHEVEAALGLVHGEAAGARLMQMAETGNAVISPQIIMGTIAFPSYHTVMTCLAVAFVRRTWAFWPLMVLNLAMLPAILSHGGHHVSDMIGGVAVFGAALWCATLLVPRTKPE
ncbi:hypothetical protein Z945_390 [Sulfitobacter noctilucae]|uniref:phosphatase PAP2 family protein n=1 Tax=Sulfitobacter noctilucae TaxID=1342302 RepID=UPI0004693047|nr:phosphatase PAP2 family protein [Sulfitobacter noctilucae]KIN65348.1 hypothetical protein Z945_390 [Sulfitobacter noctilucae]